MSGQSKSRPVKAAGAEVGAERIHQKLHAAVAKSTFGSENVKKLRGKTDVENMQAAVAKSTFGSENVKKLTCLDQFCKN